MTSTVYIDTTLSTLGLPLSTSRLPWFTETILEEVYFAEQSSADEYTRMLQKEATDAGWPPMASTQLQVLFQDSGYDVTYPQEVEELILRLEYGTEITPPSPVIRNFLRKISYNSQVVL